MSIKESVEPESRSEINLSTTEVSAESSGRENSVVSTIRRDRSYSERADALSTTSPALVRTGSTQLLLRTGVQELQTNFPELRQWPEVRKSVPGC